MQTQMIPLSRLTRSPRNVRKTGGTSIADLAASIAHHGLLQNLIVLPADDGRYEVVAGARRLAALQQLVGDGLIAVDLVVPCQIADAATDGEVSLAENVVREAMHPADQFEAFQHLVDTGMAVADIAARFGVPELTVRQRLKLANVAPALIENYRGGNLALDQLMAFAVVDDHAKQLKYLKAARNRWDLEPQAIRAALTKAEIAFEEDPIARFVGVEAFEAAGGQVRRDLFNDAGGYTTDRQLLEQLAMAKLQAAADGMVQQGWAWATPMLRLDPVAESQFREAPNNGWDDRGRPKYAKSVMAYSGVLVYVNSRGEVDYRRGLLRKGDKIPATAADKAKAAEKASKPSKKGLSNALLCKLNAQMTMALRAELVARPEIALRAAVHCIALQVLYPSTSSIGNSVISLHASNGVDLSRQDDSVEKSLAGEAMAMHRKAWLERVPRKSDDLWAWLVDASDVTVHQLLAFLTAARVSQAFIIADKPIHVASYLERSLALDMRKWWKATVQGYLGHVSRAEILAALQEAGLGPKVDAEGLQTFKAKDLAKRAAQLLAEQKEPWLPKLLRPLTPAEPKAVAKGGKAKVAKKGRAK